MIMQTDAGIQSSTDTQAKPKRKRGKAKLTMQQVAEQRMQEAIKQYRAIVCQAANGDELDAKAYELAAELLERMALPTWCLDRDVRAQRDHDNASLEQQRATAQLPAAEARAAESTQRIEELERELRELRQQHDRDVRVLPEVVTSNGRRCGELKAFHPHLFYSLEDAARLRLEERDKRKPVATELMGWTQ